MTGRSGRSFGRASFDALFDAQPKRALLACAVLFALLGGIGIVILDVGHAPDIWTHVYRISAILHGDVVAHPVDAVSAYHSLASENMGGWVSNDLIELSSDFYNGHDPGAVDAASITADDGSASEVPFNNTAVYAPIAYLPQLMAFGAGELLGLPALVRYYAAEVVMLAFWTACCTAALWALPRHRLALFLVIVFPGMWFPGSFAISADSSSLALCVLYAALLYRCAVMRPAIGWSIALAAVGLLLATGKFSYAPLFALALFAVLAQRGRGGTWAVIPAFAAAVVIDIAWMRMNGGFSTSPVMVSAAEVAARNAALPALIPEMLGQIAYSITHAQASYILGREGVVAFWLCMLLAVAMLVACIARSAAARGRTADGGRSARTGGAAPAAVPGERRMLAFWCCAWLVVAGTALLVYAALWLQYTPPDTAGVLGIQYRYFLPFLPMGALMVADCLPLALGRSALWSPSEH